MTSPTAGCSPIYLWVLENILRIPSVATPSVSAAERESMVQQKPPERQIEIERTARLGVGKKGVEREARAAGELGS